MSNNRAKKIFEALTTNRGVKGSLENQKGVLLVSCDNDYHKENLPIIPAGTEIKIDFGGDFGLYAVAFINGSIHKIIIKIEQVHHIHFESIDGPL